MTSVESEKREVGVAAAEEVHAGMALGLGSGSTVYYFLEELGRRVSAGLRVNGIPTSEHTAELARQFGIPLVTFDECRALDLDVDGADEVDPNLNLIKGHGGALLREKIIARISRRRLIVVDGTKVSTGLGIKAELPVEVLPFAVSLAGDRIRELGGAPTLRRTADGDPYVTDNSNWILDCRFPPIANAAQLERELNGAPGVVENGLFVGLADGVLVAEGSGVRRLVRSGQIPA
ncbi:MAG: ribose-5-phosphate isomerase RpiA [Betaproteobacteria bacterium]|nr:ribose-5-phosphate isomerase RpiA [Betaproteobacteria bacterium]